LQQLADFIYRDYGDAFMLVFTLATLANIAFTVYELNRRVPSLSVNKPRVWLALMCIPFLIVDVLNLANSAGSLLSRPAIFFIEMFFNLDLQRTRVETIILRSSKWIAHAIQH
jgi:hypothetical protein